MKLSQQLKGSLIALLATITFSNVYIFSKLAMKDVSLASFGILWFGLALIWNLLYNWYKINKNHFKDLTKSSKRTLLLIACSELIASSAFFLAIHLTPNPTIVSFLANTSPIFVILLGFTFLKERFSIAEIIGIILILLGVGLINITESGIQLKQLTSPASLATFTFALFYGISLVLAKTKVGILPSSMITFYRNIALFLGFILYNFCLFKVPSYTEESLFYIFIGSLLGPFLGTILTFSALKYIEASKVTLIITSRSFFIILGAFIFIGILPSQNQFIGGVMTIVGIAIISIAGIYKNKRITK
ncbi:DMT family transporter [Ancylomarina sp. 16SWW S1-10-2]|uniref:DMT family transporter n=1 Tax=Ancylomarina sp. 16SWW S1-10-2 TaxID=2499681 RepID=UPI0012AD494F|nr:DMT family transporter [Ancylomarina sp. 16SWW S1-10-2]MRT91649.1 DMT family transporter [Ancylomarina sp. 16SWW S1-10-2]